MGTGRRVRELREERELTIRELARRSGLTPNGVSRIELGQRVPSSASVEKLARGLGVEPGELFAEAEAPKASPPRTVAELLDAAGVEDWEIGEPPGHVKKMFEGLSYEEAM